MNSNLMISAGIAGVLGAGTGAVMANVNALPFPDSTDVLGSQSLTVDSPDLALSAPTSPLGDLMVGDIAGAPSSSSVGADTRHLRKHWLWRIDLISAPAIWHDGC